MIEIGLLFHTTNIEKDIEPAIKRFKERMGAEPNTIFLDALYPGVQFAGLKVRAGTVVKNHFVLARVEYESKSS